MSLHWPFWVFFPAVSRTTSRTQEAGLENSGNVTVVTSFFISDTYSFSLSFKERLTKTVLMSFNLFLSSLKEVVSMISDVK